MKNLYLLIFCLSFVFFASNAQTYRLELLPQFNASFAVQKNWRFFARVEPRQLLLMNNNIDFKYQRTDFLGIFTRRLSVNKNLSLGYLIRHRNGSPAHMFLQQFTILGKYENLRLAHRIATDQTFIKGIENMYRFRYRFAVELPLQGRKLDTGEFYIRISNEYNVIYRKSGFNLEIRAFSGAGHVFNEKFRLELGLDYRLNSISVLPTHSFLINTSFLFSF